MENKVKKEKIALINFFSTQVSFSSMKLFLTYAENIAYGINDREVSIEEIHKVDKQANIHDTIIAFPQVYIYSLHFKTE